MMNKEKERVAIERLQVFAPKDGDKYYLCYSGGKDSDAIRILAQLAGVPHEVHHNLTTVDAPETVQYIKSVPGVIIDKARYADGSHKTMWNLIPKKLMPPTRIVRYCCAELKEWGGKGKLRITGVRWEESRKRSNNRGVVDIRGKEKATQRLLDSIGINYTINEYGGVVMNMDDEILHGTDDVVHMCYRDRSTTINPIVDWTEQDVWDFLHYYGCESNPLYQCGEGRIGCVGCPMKHKKMKASLMRYPKIRQAYIRAFDRMLLERERRGKPAKLNWRNGLDVMHWWIGEPYGQETLFDEEELYNAMIDM